jgi:hypothetical protein
MADEQACAHVADLAASIEKRTAVYLRIPMSANPMKPGDVSPPPLELQHLFSSFTELRARIRAREAAAEVVRQARSHEGVTDGRPPRGVDGDDGR